LTEKNGACFQIARQIKTSINEALYELSEKIENKIIDGRKRRRKETGTITVKEFMKFNERALTPEYRYAKSRVRKAAGGKDRLNALDILTLEIVSSGTRLETVLLEELIDEQVSLEFACLCAERALTLPEAPDPRLAAAIAIKKRWLKGQATDEELAAARETVADAEDAASKAAEAAKDARVAGKIAETRTAKAVAEAAKGAVWGGWDVPRWWSVWDQTWWVTTGAVWVAVVTDSEWCEWYEWFDFSEKRDAVEDAAENEQVKMLLELLTRATSPESRGDEE
jgi:hypothetical protein